MIPMIHISNLIIGVLILSTSTLAVAQSTPEASTETGRPINGFREGMWTSYYPNTKQVHYQGHYRRGKRTGRWVWKYMDGTIKEIQHYKNGRKNGPWLSYFSDGSIQSKGHFVNNVRTKQWVIRNLDRLVTQKGIYDNGLFTGDFFKDGYFHHSHIDGKLYQTSIKTEGKVQKIYHAFFLPKQRIPDPKTEHGKMYKGVKSGLWVSYFPKTKTIRYKGIYKRGQRVGTWIWYNKKGEIQAKQYYEKNQLHTTTYPKLHATVSHQSAVKERFKDHPDGVIHLFISDIKTNIL